MTEKIIIIDASFNNTKVTTVDGTKKNLIKTYDVDEYSFYALAKKIYKRFEDDKYDRIIVDVNGVGMGLLDQLIPLFEKGGYIYDPKSGKVSKNISTIRIGSEGVFYSCGKITEWSVGGKEEF